MEFIVPNFDDNSATILNCIESNNRRASDLRNKISVLQATSNNVYLKEEDFFNDLFDDNIDSIEADDDSSFEDEILFYLEDYLRLEPGFDELEIMDILPLKSNYDYRNILMRLIAESIKEIKEMTELLIDNSDEDEKRDIRTYIDNEKRKIAFINDLLKKKDIDNTNEIVDVHNTIILAPTSGGAIRVLDDLQRVSKEFYSSFKEIIDSVVNGTFKGVKRFNNNNVLSGICEVRGNSVRVLFQRIDKNTYALITAFVKKTGMDRGYQDFIKLRVTDYKNISDSLRKMINNPEFMDENSHNVELMYELLTSFDKTPELKKEGK